jgi:hypothetical protein
VRALQEAPADEFEAGPPAPSRRRPGIVAAILGGYLALSVLVLIQLWISPSGRVLASNDDDHGFFLFVMAHGERVMFHGDNPFITYRLNVPDGINMMANTSVLALSLPLAPLTHFFGPGLSVVLLLTLGLAGTAAAWFWVLRRWGVSRLGAWLGGLWCGFCPAMVAHANGHINFVSQYVVPFIVYQALRLREPGRVVRGGIALGLLITLQVFLNEEILLFTAITLTVFVVLYALMRRPEAAAVAGRFAAGLVVAGATAGVLLAYPLFVQFTGTGSYHGQPFVPDKFATDLFAPGAYARQSLAGNGALARWLSISPTEDDTFFGLPMLVLIVIGTVLLWRSVAARAIALAGLLMLVISLGTQVKAGGVVTSFPLPFGLVSHLPIINLVSVVRFGMVAATVVGVLLAFTVDRIRELPDRPRLWMRILLVVALVPVLPKPLPVVPAAPVPVFLADGMWRSYVSGGRTVVPVPLPEVTSGRTGMRWVALSHLEFEAPRGYFMGPANPPADETGSWNAPPRYTSTLLTRVLQDGVVPAVTAADRQAFRADLAFWRAGVVVLVPDARNGAALRTTLTGLFGRPPQLTGGVEIWPVPPAG